jgi:hypothetical protein
LRASTTAGCQRSLQQGLYLGQSSQRLDRLQGVETKGQEAGWCEPTAEDLAAEIPDVDAYFGSHHLPQIVRELFGKDNPVES